MEDLNLIRERLEIYFTDIYRKVWVQKNQRNNDILLTLFSKNSYRMVSLKNLKSISYQEIVNRLNPQN